MDDTGNVRSGSNKSKEQYEKEAVNRNNAVLQQLHDGKLTGQVTVILVLGPSGAGKTNLLKLLTSHDLQLGHKLDSGTVESWSVLAKIGGKRFLFIDTPGFGHPDLPIAKVKNAICHMLGYFTRRLGGIHGILYVHDIRTDRTSPGMRESFEFLDELTNGLHPRVTFITTRWDLIVKKELAKCEERETELHTREWKKFRIDNKNNCWSFRFGASCEDDTPQEKGLARKTLVDMILNGHEEAELRDLRMPFREWTWGQKATVVLMSPLWVTGGIILKVFENSSVSVSIGVYGSF